MTRRNVTTKGPVAIVIAAIVFAACSAYRPPSLPRDHPASPEAAAAPVPAPSKALAWESPTEPPKPAGKATSHTGHSELRSPAAERSKPMLKRKAMEDIDELH